MTGIDTSPLAEAVDYERTTLRAATRADLTLHGAVVLFVGRLDHRKGIPELLAGLAVLAELPDVPPWSVLFVGSGPLDNEVDHWSAAHPAIRVVRTGFVQPSNVSKYYAAADVFVLASLGDPWPLVTLEALVAGLPQVTSWMVGSASDLIVSDEIGDIVDPTDARAFALHLANRIRRAPVLVSDDTRAGASATWSPAAAAGRAIASICACLGVPPSQIGVGSWS